jgi:hypothetical protein
MLKEQLHVEFVTEQFITELVLMRNVQSMHIRQLRDAHTCI